MNALARPRRSKGTAPLEERAFHRWLLRALPDRGRSLLPMGDDAAALAPPPGRCAVLSTDSLYEGSHFLHGTPPARVGAATVAVGLSDVAAKGAEPAAVLLALGLPRGTSRRWAEELVSSAERFARRYGARVVGGDTKPSASFAVTSTVLGWARPEQLIRRDRARPGDLLLTTGTVGRGGAASRGLLQSPRARARAVEELLAIRPRVREGVRLARIAHAMLDTSDGLAEGAWLLAAASKVRVEVEEALLPWDRRLARLEPVERRRLAFYGGDYELLAAVRPSEWKRAARSFAGPRGSGVRVIGRVRPGRGAYLHLARGAIRMPSGGWRAFG